MKKVASPHSMESGLQKVWLRGKEFLEQGFCPGSRIARPHSGKRVGVSETEMTHQIV